MSQRCPVPMGDGVCGEPNSLEIISQFNRLFQDRLAQLEAQADGGCLMEKIKLQEEWIHDLTEQNNMLVRVVQQLESEAVDRVHQLEEKLQRSGQCLHEVMKKYREHNFANDLLWGPLQKIAHYEDDLKNVMEFIRRIREEKRWSLEGLFFHTVTAGDLMGPCPFQNCSPEDESLEGQEELRVKEGVIQELTDKVNYYESFGNPQELTRELHCRRQECDSLQQEMADARQALAEEVAAKHDEVMFLKKDLQILEERCLQADKQTAFKEDIVRELRREVKQLKQQVTAIYVTLVSEQIASYLENSTQFDSSPRPNQPPLVRINDELLLEQLNLIKALVTKLFTVDCGLKYLEERTLSVTACVSSRQVESLNETNRKLENENIALKEATTVVKTHLEQLDQQFNNFLRERNSLRRTKKVLERAAQCSVKEKESLQCKCQVLLKEIEQLKFEKAEADKRLHSQIVLQGAESRQKITDLEHETRTALERVVSLNEENVSLTETVDLLRQRSDYTTNFTQEEVGKLNFTIEELRTNLEKTRFVHDQEEEAHRKEISLLNHTITSLQDELKGLKGPKSLKACKICKKRSKVGFLENSQVQADLDVQEADLMKALKEAQTRMREEIERKNSEIDTLRNKVTELEGALKTCEERAVNLQDAVNSYYNTVTVLEQSEETAQSQIQQQKITISNLQQALVEAKQEVDEIRKKSRDNDVKRQGLVTLLERALEDMEDENDLITKQSEKIHREFDTLQDLNFALEMEHCDHLQDMDSLESQLKKYQYLFNVNEDQMKKLSKQKRCYEEIIAYFKQEMGLMADQLNNLQELLTLSNESAQQESTRIMTAFTEVQSLNERLSSQLCACEQKVQLENQMNQLHEAKICELQRLITDKDRDLSKQDTTITDIRTTLHDSQKQNENLQKTVTDLNNTIADLQRSVNESCAGRKSCEEFKVQIDDYCHKLEEVRQNLEEKTAECLKLEMAYNKERRALKAIQKQLKETESRQQEKQHELVSSLDEIRGKFRLSEETNSKLRSECENLQTQLASLSRKEAVKDLEIKRYRKIVGDLKATMIELNSELNKNLAQKEVGHGCKNPNCHTKKEDSKLQDVCLGCPCEVEFYQKMVDILKQSVSELKRKLTDTEQKNRSLEEDVKHTKDELNRQLAESGRKECKIAELERELQVKSLQLNDVKKSANEINGSKCVQLAYAQEEIAHLKNEVANILNRQFVLKRENEDLKAETTQLHCTINCLHDQTQTLKEQLDQYLARIKNLNCEKEVLLRKNNELLSELRSIQSIACSPEKQQRAVRQLEGEIEELRNSKNEICSESRNVIKNVKAWVTEQKKINSLMAKREQELMQTIRQLNKSKEIPIVGRKTCRARCNNLCSSPYSLGSQGSASIYDVESPPPSPDFGVNNEWYSTTFRAESENESEDDYCINTLENLTQQMRQSNRTWMEGKRSARDCRVTKERKS